MTHHIELDTIRLAEGNHTKAKADRGEACLIYEGHIERNGYGKRGHVWVHREALAEKLGRPVTPGMDACHTCDVRACINPDHLYEGTRTRNILDSVERGRWNHPAGERHPRARLSDAQVADIRRRYQAGESHAAQARSLGVHETTISRLARGIKRGAA